MRLFEFFNKSNIVNEGGSMPGVGAIHIDEIKPTLEKLEKTLGIDLQNNVLGSVGKREFSGDIDVAIDIPEEGISQLVKKLENTPLILDLAKSSVIMTKVKIENFDSSKQTERPRTGYVQIDFMPGDPDWMKTYYHSPSEKESKYKGVFRNLMLASIVAVYQNNPSDEKIEDGRPLEVERWMWSPVNGLIRIKRTPVPKKNGTGYTKKNKNVMLSEPIKTADGIAKALGLESAADLNSFESIKAAIEKAYSPDLVQQILTDFSKNSTVQQLGVPEELK